MSKKASADQFSVSGSNLGPNPPGKTDFCYGKDIFLGGSSYVVLRRCSEILWVPWIQQKRFFGSPGSEGGSRKNVFSAPLDLGVDPAKKFFRLPWIWGWIQQKNFVKVSKNVSAPLFGLPLAAQISSAPLFGLPFSCSNFLSTLFWAPLQLLKFPQHTFLSTSLIRLQ